MKSDPTNDDGDDDEFEDDENTATEATHESESVASAEDNNQDDPLNDTGKNSHFCVWKCASKSSQIKNKLLREHDEEAHSDNDLDDQKSVYSDSSSDQSDLETSDAETDNEFKPEADLKPAVSSESLKSVHLNEEDAEIFVGEASEIVKRGLVENLNVDNVILEINSCKHAHNIQIDDLNYYLVRVILNMPFMLNKTNQFDYLAVLKQQFVKAFGKLCANYFTSTKKSQRIFLDAMLDYFLETKPVNNVNLLDTVYLKLVNYLYNDESVGFLSDEVILDWYESKMNDKKTSEKHKTGLKKLEKFIEWLEDEEDDDDEEDEDEDDEE